MRSVNRAAATLEVMGVEQEEIDRVDFEYRLRDCERLELQSATGDLRAGFERSFSPDQALPKGGD